MQKQSTNVVEASQLALLESRIFDQCPLADVIEYVDKMHDNYICSDAADDSFERNVATVCKKPLMKLLACLQSKADPYETVMLQITYPEIND